MKIIIVTINYNGSEETLRLLNSLKGQIHPTIQDISEQVGSEQADHDFEIMVIDNASEEADFGNLETYYTTNQFWWRAALHICRQRENMGFSGGNNVGIRQALKNGADWVVLLNNDTWVEKDFMKRLKAVLSVKNGVVGVPLVEGNGTAYCGKIRWLKSTLIHINDLRCRYVDKCQIYAIGGAVAIHKNVLEKIGLLDEKYFLYFEDADFSIRAREAGFDISIADPPAGGLNVHHHVSSSTRKLGSPLLLRYHYRNALYFNLKNGPRHIKLLVWPWSLVILIKQLSKIAIKQNVEESKAILSGVMDFYKNRMDKISFYVKG